MVTSDPVLQVLAAVLVLAIPLGCAIVARATWSTCGVGIVVVASTSATVSLALSVTLLRLPDLPAAMLDAAIASAVAASLVIVASAPLGVVGGAIFAMLWSLAVFQPVFIATFGATPSLVQTAFGAVDVAAVHATHVAAAGSLIALTLVSRSRRHHAAPFREASLRRALVGLAFVIVGATAWMLGAERVVSDASGRIVVNALVGLVLGALVWALVERIAGRSFTPHGLLLGVVMAWGAMGLGSAFLSPMALAATTVIAVAASAGIVVRASEAHTRLWRTHLAVVVAVAVGGVILALLADGFGLAATGSIGGVTAQLSAALVVAAAAFVGGLLCAGCGMLAATLIERARARRAETVEVARGAEAQ